MAGILMNDSSERFRGSAYTFREEGIDLGSEKQDDGEVIEEKQEDDGKTYLSCIVTQKVDDIEREKVEID